MFFIKIIVVFWKLKEKKNGLLMTCNYRNAVHALYKPMGSLYLSE